MKTIFFGEAASDSGSFGFSEAWPLFEETGQHWSKRWFACRDFLVDIQTYQPAQTAWTFIRSAISTISSTLA